MLHARKLLVAIAAGTLLTAGAAVARPDAARFIPTAGIADAPEGFIDMCHRDRTLCDAGLSEEPSAAPAMAATGARHDASAIGGPIGNALYSPPPVVGLPAALARNTGTAALEPARSARAARGAGGLSGDTDEARLVRKINQQVNRQLVPVSDLISHGVEEEWDRPGRVGRPPADCEDYAIEKRMRLVEAGFPPDRLFFAVVYRANFGLHTILIVRMADGDYVLDSARRDILPWSQARYVWLRAQSPTDPLVWRRVAS